jgi:hypothetical protein
VRISTAVVGSASALRGVQPFRGLADELRILALAPRDLRPARSIFWTGLRHDVLRERSTTSLLISFSSLARRLLRRCLILRQQLQQQLPLRLVCCSGEEPQIVLELFSVDEPVHGRCTAYVNAHESFADHQNVSLWLRETGLIC